MKLPNTREIDVLKSQLAKSASSIGANLEEAQSSSDKEFVQKLRIALREANETVYWFRLIEALKLGDSKNRELLLKESREISLILGAIVSRLNKKLKS